MCAAQVPQGLYELQLHTRWFRKAGSKTATLENPQLLESIQGKKIPFKGSDIQPNGKQLGIPLLDNIWLRVQFALHGHALLTSREQYNAMVQAWDTEKDTKKYIYIFGAIVGVNMYVILVDRYVVRLQYHYGIELYSTNNGDPAIVL